MSDSTDTAPAALPAGAAPDARERAARLAPDEPFPDELLELSLEQLQILHSRICRQLDLEYATELEGRHPITLDRLRELQIEFDSRLLG